MLCSSAVDERRWRHHEVLVQEPPVYCWKRREIARFNVEKEPGVLDATHLALQQVGELLALPGVRLGRGAMTRLAAVIESAATMSVPDACQGKRRRLLTSLHSASLFWTTTISSIRPKLIRCKGIMNMKMKRKMNPALETRCRILWPNFDDLYSRINQKIERI